MLRREYTDLEVRTISLPWYWGVSYCKVLTAQIVYHIIPFNLVVRWTRDLLFWIRTAGVRGYRQRIESQAFQNGQGNIRSRILVRVTNNLVSQGMPREGADGLAEHILRDHLGI